MSLNKKKILGIGVTMDSKKNILEYIRKYLETGQKKPLIIATPNPEQAVLAYRDVHFREIINRADVAIPDGIGLALVSGIKKISGVELMEDLCRLASERGLRIGLIGGRGGVAVKALECLQRKYPGLEGWGEEPEIKIQSDQSDQFTNPTNDERRRSKQQYNNITIEQYRDGAIEEYAKKSIDTIRTMETRLVFVGLGAPKQEFFVHSLSLRSADWRRSNLKNNGIAASPTAPRNDNMVFMSVGGAFDEISGRLPRAPALIDAMGLKWFWRLVLEPWRWKRQLALLKFLWLAFKAKIKHTA